MCRVSDCSVTCTLNSFDDCEITTPIETTALVQQVILTGSIDFLVNLTIQNQNCQGPGQLTTFACCEVSACVDNPICIFGEEIPLVNCDGPFCPPLGDIDFRVELGDAIEICGNPAYEATITFTFERDTICRNFLPIPQED